MRRLFSACGLAVMLTCSATSVHAQTVAVGPYYATPSWDQTLACTTAASCPRFVVLANFNNQAVLDRETGLVWQQSPSAAPGNFSAVVLGCSFFSIGGRSGWRVPTFQEMMSLFDNLALPAGHPFSNIQESNLSVFPQITIPYWTATNDPQFPDGSRVLGVMFVTPNLGIGVTSGLAKAVSSGPVWCVRGGVGVSSNQF